MQKSFPALGCRDARHHSSTRRFFCLPLLVLGVSLTPHSHLIAVGRLTALDISPDQLFGSESQEVSIESTRKSHSGFVHTVALFLGAACRN